MCIDNTRCNAYISLNDIGISAEGCLRDIRWLTNITIPCDQSATYPKYYIYLPDTQLLHLQTVAHGAFGTISEASYTRYLPILNIQHKQRVYVKKPIRFKQDTLYEACIQKLVYEKLAILGFPTGAPKVLRIFSLSDGVVCFAMEQIENSVTLDKYLDRYQQHTMLSKIIIDCLLQLCAMLSYLDTEIGINHRDLKPSNFLIVEHTLPVRKVLIVENEIIEIESHYSLTFIDFGFACLGSRNTGIVDVSLSTVYSKSDPCPKKGRDLFLFIGFLYLEYHLFLPDRLLKLFESWLDPKLCEFMRKDSVYSKNWLYFMAGSEKITKFNSSPVRIVKDLQAMVEPL